ncbi:MAG TPA: DUF2218 domain-containing protein [Caulobacteraceae bacterium]|jgi:hypothetical protein
MSVAVTRVPTAHASRYLQQLCKHWSHKYPVEFTPENGRIEMSAAVLILDADGEGLGLRLSAEPENLERMEGVVAEHLQRFAFREELAFDWKPA